MKSEGIFLRPNLAFYFFIYFLCILLISPTWLFSSINDLMCIYRTLNTNSLARTIQICISFISVCLETLHKTISFKNTSSTAYTVIFLCICRRFRMLCLNSIAGLGFFSTIKSYQCHFIIVVILFASCITWKPVIKSPLCSSFIVMFDCMVFIYHLHVE